MDKSPQPYTRDHSQKHDPLAPSENPPKIKTSLFVFSLVLENELSLAWASMTHGRVHVIGRKRIHRYPPVAGQGDVFGEQFVLRKSSLPVAASSIRT